jgi:hypothetical protein
MTWSGFATVPRYSVGFRIESKRSHDTEGLLTLEHLSEVVDKLEVGGEDVYLLIPGHPVHPLPAAMPLPAPTDLTDNVPYFRYAMAYRI